MRRSRRDSSGGSSGGGGINGSLTPARKRYPSGLSNPSTPKHSELLAKNTSRALQYPSKSEGPPTWHGGHARGGEHWKCDGVGVGVGVEMGDRSASGAGISLHETEDRIRQLERAEFDLKMRLYYTEERLEEAAGGADAVQLHREVAHAKRHRAQAEESMRAASEEAKELRAKCETLDARCRDMEATWRAELEKHDAEEAEKLAKLRKHVRLLEDTLRAERAENARLRLTGTEPKPSSHSLDEFIEEGSGHVRRYSSRRKSTGDASEAGTATRGAGIGGREQRERHLTLEAKVRSQDSSMRSLRADITTLRRRLRTQAECLERQKLEMKALTQAAEQVACVEAEEIARLAVELEQAVGEAKSERQRRRTAEERLVTAQKRLLGKPTPTAVNHAGVRGRRPATTGSAVRDPTRSPSPSSRRPLASGDVRSPGRRADVAPTAEQQHTKKTVCVAARGRAGVLGDDDEARDGGGGGGGSMENDTHDRSGKRESKTTLPAKREMSSTVASRGRSSTSPRNRDSVGVRGTVRDRAGTPTRDDSRSSRGAAGQEMASTIASRGRLSTSPRNRDSVGGRGTVRGRSGTPPAGKSRGGGGAAGKERRRPWGSPPPEPKIRREGSLEHTFKPSDNGRQVHGRVSVSPERSATVAATCTTPRREDANTSHSPEENADRKGAVARRLSLGSSTEKGGARVSDSAHNPPRREIPKPKAGRRLSAGKIQPELSSVLTKKSETSARARPGDTAAGGSKDGGDDRRISSHEFKNYVDRRGSAGGVNVATAVPEVRSDDEGPEEGNHQGGNFGPEEVSNRVPQRGADEEVVVAGGTGGQRRALFQDEEFRWGAGEGDDGGGSGLDALTLSTMSADLTETVARELRLAVATSTTTPDTDATNASAFGGGTTSQVLDVGFSKDSSTLLPLASQRNACSGQREGAGAPWEQREYDGAGSRNSTSSWQSGGGTVGIGGDVASRDHAVNGGDRRMSPRGGDTHLDWRHRPDHGGASRTSREVADLESDVQNLFQFFAGRREAGLGGAGDVAALAAEARASAAIGQALALWGSAGD